jgi:hypothetical protein
MERSPVDVFCHNIRIGEEAPVDVTEVRKGTAIGGDEVTAPAAGTLALNGPAIGDDLLSAPAEGTPTAVAVTSDAGRGPATSSRQERRAIEQTAARKILPEE